MSSRQNDVCVRVVLPGIQRIHVTKTLFFLRYKNQMFLLPAENQKGVNDVQLCSIENQKGVSDVQLCSIENQKGAFIIDFVQQQWPSGCQWNIIVCNTLLALSGWYLSYCKLLLWGYKRKNALEYEHTNFIETKWDRAGDGAVEACLAESRPILLQ